MDGRRFDNLTVSLVAPSRRETLRLLAGAALGALLPVRRVAARKCTPGGNQRCEDDSDCCTGRCRRGRCSGCPRGQRPCPDGRCVRQGACCNHAECRPGTECARCVRGRCVRSDRACRNAFGPCYRCAEDFQCRQREDLSRCGRCKACINGDCRECEFLLRGSCLRCEDGVCKSDDAVCKEQDGPCSYCPRDGILCRERGTRCGEWCCGAAEQCCDNEFCLSDDWACCPYDERGWCGITRPTCCPRLGCVDTDSDPRACGRFCEPCPEGYACCNGLCDDLENSQRNCGGCGNDCPEGWRCCTGNCFDHTVDPNHCGECDRACDPGETCCGGNCINLAATESQCCDGRRVCDIRQRCCTNELGLPACCS